jgi:hypothetical protein
MTALRFGCPGEGLPARAMMDVDLDGTIVPLARVTEPASFRSVNSMRHTDDYCGAPSFLHQGV